MRGWAPWITLMSRKSPGLDAGDLDEVDYEAITPA
jgi:hypothetical protein